MLIFLKWLLVIIKIGMQKVHISAVFESNTDDY